ncbi:hypothetical protein JK358_38625 [Nocardia sp. 2]|uniref:Stress response protein YvgO n=1 Tax=Nocardia acididurans TaxID=2802282 RepID=A0ABS1MI36_9NOCA|nr:hypothetical protein [Nocardia acididurans]MBL1080328.1 hypothetical protein [Nocardia acididurans]
MRIKRFVTAALLAASVATTLGVAAPAATAAPSIQGESPLNIDVNANDLLEKVINGVRDAKNVEGYLASLLEDAFINAGNGQYGAMVCKMHKALDCVNNASAAAFKSVMYNGDIFGVWLIRPGSGTFHRGADGGYQNWTFMGYQDYNRDTMTVTF